VVTAMAIPATRGMQYTKNPRKRRDLAIVADANLIDKLIHVLHPISSLLIMPLFALANCAVPLGITSTTAATATATAAAAAATAGSSKAVEAAAAAGSGKFLNPSSLPGIGVLLGLLIGKPIGIIGLTMAAVKGGLSSFPFGMALPHLSVVGALGAIGFTMSLFLTEAALTGVAAQSAKIGIFISSLLAVIGGSIYMRSFPIFDPNKMLFTSTKHGDGGGTGLEEQQSDLKSTNGTMVQTDDNGDAAPSVAAN